MLKQSFVPLVAYYPPGLICAKDVTRQFCPNAGDSGSPLMVKKSCVIKSGLGRPNTDLILVNKAGRPVSLPSDKKS